MNTPETYNRVVAVGIDMQNDFFPGGALGVAEGDEVLAPFNDAGQWVRNQNGLVVYTRDWHPAVTEHFAEYGGQWPPHCIANTYGAEFKTGLDVRDGDPILSKGTDPQDNGYSGFDGKAHDGLTLEAILYPEKHEAVAVVIGGLATDYCVEATVMDATTLAKYLPQERHLGVYVLEEAIRAVDVNPGDGKQAIADMEASGAIFISNKALLNGTVIDVRN